MTPPRLPKLAPLAALAAVVMAVGCAQARLRREGEAAVRAYNDALVVAYRTNDPRGLAAVATESEVRKLVALIDLKKASGLALESEMTALEVLGAERARSGMVVRTKERWRYHDRALRPGMPAGTRFVADMWMSWELVREGRTWKVRGGQTERCDYLEPKGFAPGGGDRRRETRRSAR